jgi:hypothetical protein
MTAEFVESRPVHKTPFRSGRDILDGQIRNGRGVIDRNDWARSAFEDLRRRCPHVPEEELVRLFHDKAQSQLELIQGDAIFREYNATHLLGRKRVKVRPRPASRAVVVSRPAEPPAKPAKAAPKPATKPAKKAARPKPRPAKAAPRKMAKAKRRKR